MSDDAVVVTTGVLGGNMLHNCWTCGHDDVVRDCSPFHDDDDVCEWAKKNGCHGNDGLPESEDADGCPGWMEKVPTVSADFCQSMEDDSDRWKRTARIMCAEERLLSAECRIVAELIKNNPDRGKVAMLCRHQFAIINQIDKLRSET